MAQYITEVDLIDPLPERLDLAGRTKAYVLVRYRRRPITAISLDCPDGVLHGADLAKALGWDFGGRERLMRETLTEWLLHSSAANGAQLPSWSIIVCTRNRTDDLRRCLDSLLAVSATGGEIIIVDNAPSDERTAELVQAYSVRYIREDRPGLNWARSSGAHAAQGEILLYTDDDVVVDREWVSTMLAPFTNPRVAAVTGLTLPLELDTTAQELFERYGGFGRGFDRREFDRNVLTPAAAGRVGAGANMAIRRDTVLKMRLFDVELDCGTAARTGGDAYAFYRILAAGYQIVYTPEGLTWHRHRRDYASLRRTLSDYSVGGYVFLLRVLLQHRDLAAISVGLSWFRHDHLRQLKRALLRKPNALPLDLVLAQIRGIADVPAAYRASRKQEKAYLRQPRKASTAELAL